MSFEILDKNDLYAVPPPEWLVNNLIVDGGLFLLAAKPKSGKSMFTLDLAFSVALGEQFLGWDTVQRPVVLLPAEDGKARVGQRMREAFKMKHNDPGDIRAVFKVADRDNFDGLLDTLRAAEKPVLLIVDPLIEIFGLHGVLDENAAPQVAPVLAKLRNFCQSTGSTVVVVHHTTKNGKELRGSSAIMGSVDGWLLMTRDKNSPTISLDCDPVLRDDGYEYEFNVEFDPNHQPRPKFIRRGALVTKPKKPKVDPIARAAAAIVDALQAGGPMNVKTLTTKIGIGSKSKTYKEATTLLVQSGRIEWDGSATKGEWRLLPVPNDQTPTVVDPSPLRPSPTGEGTNEPNGPNAPLSGVSLTPAAETALEKDDNEDATPTPSTLPTPQLSYEDALLAELDAEQKAHPEDFDVLAAQNDDADEDPSEDDDAA